VKREGRGERMRGRLHVCDEGVRFIHKMGEEVGRWGGEEVRGGLMN